MGIKYAGGVMVVADVLGSYGRLARFKEMRRVREVNAQTLIGASGEMSDFAYIMELLEEQTTRDFTIDDGATMTPREVHNYLHRVQYNRRSKVDPLWNDTIVAGFADGEAFLGFTDLYGSNFEENVAATGFGEYLALPLMRKAWHKDLTEAEAKKILDDCMTVLYYRDCNAINRIICGKVTADGVEISEPYDLATKWDYARFQNPQSAE